MASIRTTAIRLREQQRVVQAYQQLLALVDDPDCRRRYRRKAKVALRIAERLARRLNEKKKKTATRAA
ncbi:MAG: hypothetical protein RIN56_07965 [Sporomusaceae bacterium]|nr:hypothetical protein [Sporomusaceae bacterium]